MEKTPNNQKVNILNILKIFLSHWPHYLISVFIFGIFGIFYLMFASKTYMVFSKIIINNAQMNVRGNNQYINVNDLMNQEKTLGSEISYLISTPLIREVIEDMKLTVSYYIQPDIIPKELSFSLQNMYKESPFIVIIDNKHIQPINTLFYIHIIDDNTFTISADEEDIRLYDYTNEKRSADKYNFSISGTYKFGQTVSNKNCSFEVLLNSNYIAENYEGSDLFFRFNNPMELAYEFQEAIGIETNMGSPIIDISFKWENLNLCTEFLSQLISKYIEKNLEKKNFNANNTIEYIEQQLANVQGTLGQSENRLQNFRTSRDVINISEKTKNLYSQIQDLERNRDDIQSRYQSILSLKEYIEQNKNSSTFSAPSSSELIGGNLNTLIEELTTLTREKQDLINTNQLKNPRIKTLDANIATIKNVINDNINFEITAVSKELKDVNNRLAQLNAEFSRLPQTQRQLFELERDFNINDEVYSSLLNQRIQAKIMKASNRPDISIIEPVRYVEVTSPNLIKIGFISLFIGLFFPTCYVVITNFLTQKIKTLETLSNFCPLQSVGTIPHSDIKENDLIFKYPQIPIVERFHTIRGNITYYHRDPHKVILVTSTLPNEGKSFTSLNLALSFASANLKTLLVAFDLRKNSRTFNDLNITPLAGLDLYLTDRVNLDDIIIKTKYPNLDFISNGKVSNNPAPLFSSLRIEELFDVLRSEYDYVIVDTPPFGMVSDAFILMRYADVKLYVSRINVVTKKTLRNSMEELLSKDVKDIYLIRNDIASIDNTYADKYAYEEPKKKKFLGFLQKSSST